MTACGVAIAGCGSGGSSSSGGSASSSSSTGKTLVELDASVAPTLEPDSVAGNDSGFEQAFVNLAEPLLTLPTKEVNGVLQPDYSVGQDDFAPDLVTSYTHTGKTFTMDLRQGVKSCAGNEFTSADVVYTFKRAKSMTGSAPNSYFVGSVASIFDGKALGKDAKTADKTLGAEVQAEGKYKVKFTQTGSNELFPKILTIWSLAPWDSKAMLAHATAKDPYSHTYTQTKNAPAFGPYCLKSWDKGSQMTFTANPGWWQPKPAYTNVTMKQVPSDAQRLTGIAGGQATVATTLTPSQFQQVGKVASVLDWHNPANDVLLGINYKYPPFNDPTKSRLIRQAIAYAMPYDQIKSNVYYGKFQKDNGLVPSNAYGYKQDATYSTNLAKAKALMVQAGYPNGTGLPKNSKAWQLSYTAENSSTLQPLATLIKTAMQQIGLPIQLNPIPAAQLQTSENATYSAGMFLRDNSRALVADVGYSTLLYFVSKAGGGLAPSTNYASDKVDALYKTSASQTGSARLATLGQIQDTVMQDLPLVPIGAPDSQIAVQKGVTGWLGNIYDLVYWRYLKPASN